LLSSGCATIWNRCVPAIRVEPADASADAMLLRVLERQT
jgi:hypothetical protein